MKQVKVPKSQILVLGYWHRNLGDDLFLKILAERYSNTTFNIYINKENFRPFKTLVNVKPVFRYNSRTISRRAKNKLDNFLFKFGFVTLNSIQRELLNYKQIVEIGGSIFIQPSTGFDSNYYLRKAIGKSGIDYSILGCNFGPYSSEQQVQEYQKIFDESNWVSFRDSYSFQLFKNNNDNLHCFPDIVFGLDISPYCKSQDYHLISVIYPHSAKYREDYISWLTTEITYIVKILNEKVVLMGFCAEEGDEKVADIIIERLGNDVRDNVKKAIHSNIEDSLNIISKAKKIIATRYHAMILAWVFHKPTFVISYSRKVDEVIHDIAPQQKFHPINKIAEIEHAEYSEYPLDYFDNVISQSRGHFNYLDTALILN